MSLLPAPRCMETNGSSVEAATRVNPPGMTENEDPSVATKVRSRTERRSKPAGVQTGPDEGLMQFWAMNSLGLATRSSLRLDFSEELRR